MFHLLQIITITTKLMVVTASNLNRFSKFFHWLIQQ